MDVSVIIPTHNRAKLLPAALDSVLAQTTPARLEAIVIDDGSTDDTAAVIAPYLQRHHDPAGARVIRYHQQPKQGVVAARNKALAESAAPLVAFLDSDDYWHNEKLARQLDILNTQPDVGLVHTSFRYVNEQGRFTDAGPQRLDNPCRGNCVDALLSEDLVIFSSVLVRRDLINQAASAEPHGLPFDPRWTNGQDYDLLLRIARLAPFAYIPEPLTLYRLHAGHAAMGNLPRVFGYHCRVQLDFARRFGPKIGISHQQALEKARYFLHGRAQSLFWQRRLPAVRQLCELARELGVFNDEFALLERRAARPAWLYAIKDRLDRLRSRTHRETGSR